jgi:hypothetical protein
VSGEFPILRQDETPAAASVADASSDKVRRIGSFAG